MIYRQDEDLAPPHGELDSTRLWVSDQQWLAILERVQRGQPAVERVVEEDNRRLYARQAYECRCLLRLSAEAGTYIVRTRDISSGGLRFVHGQSLRPSTRCTIALQSDFGPGRIISAVVAWCKEIDLYDPGVEAFELGLKFDTPIDTRAFIDNGGAA
ncbi:MAG: PilZ domain-containing protein [Phycisphaeraceae bacterium]